MKIININNNNNNSKEIDSSKNLKINKDKCNNVKKIGIITKKLSQLKILVI